jgi:glycosyltransferase involved in cell wall biosynthesis
VVVARGRQKQGNRLVKVLIATEHASARFGGEAALPLHYFRVMRARGIDVRMITHARVRDELSSGFPEDRDRIFYIEDAFIHRLMWRLGKFLPGRLSYITTGFVSRIVTQLAQRQLARELISKHGIDVVHQPMPVSPREPSLLHGLGAPVVIGPLNGNMEFPPAFRTNSERRLAFIERVARGFSETLNAWMPGKRHAAAIMVANERTRAALPGKLRGEVLLIPENGVDLSLWQERASSSGIDATQATTQMVFMGRLISLKAVDLLLMAFDRARAQASMSLTVLGDGEEGAALRQLARELGIAAAAPGEPGTVFFAGWKTQAECARELRDADVLLLPSLRECGGAVVLEAMACRLPVVATAWGGPLDYLDSTTGILVPPTSREEFIAGLADAMVRLSQSPELRRRLGDAARARIEAEFDWERKMDVILDLYARASGKAAVPA